MAETSYENVRVLLFDPDLSSRTGARYALQSVGITKIDEYTSLANLPDALELTDYDLLVLDCTAGTRGIFALIREVRKNERGHNPFVTVILTIWQPSETVVLDAMASGADDLVIKPFSANQIASRIGMLVGNRKPFVFSDEYAGPVRRLDPGAAASLAPIEVPNTLRAKTRDETLLPMTPTLVSSVINFQHCKRLEARLKIAIEGVLAYFNDSGAMDFPIGLVSELLLASEQLSALTKDGGFEHVAEMCDTLKDVAMAIQAEGAAAGKKHVQVLEATTAAIRAALRNRDEAVRSATDIAETMQAIRATRSGPDQS